MALTGLGAGRSVSDLGLNSYSNGRSVSDLGLNSYSKKNLTGLEAGRSVSDLGLNSYSKERRSPGWRLEDPSRTLGLILTLRSGAHRAGGWKIRLGPGNIDFFR